MNKLETIQKLIELRKENVLTEQELIGKMEDVLGTEIEEFKEKKAYKGKERYANNHALWTRQDIQLIESNKDKSDAWLANRLGRTKASVTWRRTYVDRQKGIWKRKRKDGEKVKERWTADEEKFICNYHSKLNATNLAKALYRTARAVENKIFELQKDGRFGKKEHFTDSRGNQVKHRAWTKEDDAFIMANYGKINGSKIAEGLNRTYGATEQRIKVLKDKGLMGKKKKDDTVQVGENKYPRKYSQMG